MSHSRFKESPTPFDNTLILVQGRDGTFNVDKEIVYALLNTGNENQQVSVLRVKNESDDDAEIILDTFQMVSNDYTGDGSSSKTLMDHDYTPYKSPSQLPNALSRIATMRRENETLSGDPKLDELMKSLAALEEDGVVRTATGDGGASETNDLASLAQVLQGDGVDIACAIDTIPSSGTEIVTATQPFVKNGHGSGSGKKNRKSTSADLLFSVPDVMQSKRSSVASSTAAAAVSTTAIDNGTVAIACTQPIDEQSTVDFLTDKCTNDIYDEIMNLEKEIRKGNVSLDELKAAGDSCLLSDDTNDVSVDISNLELDCNPEDLVIDDFINNIAKLVELDEGANDASATATTTSGTSVPVDEPDEKIAIESESDDERDPMLDISNPSVPRSKSRLAAKLKLSERSLQIHQKLSKSSASRLSLKNFQKSEQIKATADGSVQAVSLPAAQPLQSVPNSKSSKKRLSLRGDAKKQRPLRLNRTRYTDTDNEERDGGDRETFVDQNCVSLNDSDAIAVGRTKKKSSGNRNGSGGGGGEENNGVEQPDGENETIDDDGFGDADDDDEDIVTDRTWDSEDDPDRLWCICRKPHNNRFMISCDRCEDWFHGKCVNVTQSMGKKWEQTGKEWSCPNCVKKDGKISRKNVQIKCANCRQPIETKVSAYCSDKCISAHIEGLEKFVLIDVITMKCLSGNAMPLLVNLKNWLKDHPTFQVVKKENKDFSPVVARPRISFLQRKIKPVPGESGGPNAVKKQSKTETEIIQKIAQQNQTPDKSRTKFLDIHSLPDFRRSQPMTGTSTSAPPLPNPVTNPIQKTTTALAASRSNPVPGPSPSPSSNLSPSPNQSSIERKKSDKQTIALSQHSQLLPPRVPKAKINPSDREKVIRENVRKSMRDNLEIRISGSSDIKIENHELQKLVDEIELELFKLFKVPGQKYLNKYRSLLFNIKDAKNNTLWKRICKKKIAPSRLVQLSTDELASQELSSWRERETKHQLEIIKRTELEALKSTQQFIMKSRHGEELREVAKVKASVDESGGELVADVALQDPTATTSANRETTGSIELSTATASHSSSSKDKSKESGGGGSSRNKKDHDHRKHDHRRGDSSSSSSTSSKERDNKNHRDKSSSKHKEKRNESKVTTTTAVGYREVPSGASVGGNDDDDNGLDEGSKALLKDIESLTKVDDSLLREFERRQELEEQQKKQKELDELKQLEQLNRQAEERLTREIEELERQVQSGETHCDVSETSKQRSSLRNDSSLGDGLECDTNNELNGCDDGGGNDDVDDDDDVLLESGSKKVLATGHDDYTVANSKWRGLLHISDSSNFFINAVELSAIGTDLETDITKFLQIKGRLEFSIGWNYIEKMKKSQISLLKLVPASYEDKAGYLDYFNYLYTRSRLGVVKCETDNIKDFYIFPWPESTPLPAILNNFVSKRIEDDNPNTLLAILVRSKRKMAQLNSYEVLSTGTSIGGLSATTTAASLDPRAKKPKKVRSGATPVPKLSNSRKTTSAIAIADTKDDRFDDNLDEPYSPTDYSMQLNENGDDEDAVDTDLRLLAPPLPPPTSNTPTSVIASVPKIPVAPPPPAIKHLKQSKKSPISTDPVHEPKPPAPAVPSILDNFEPFSNRFLTIPGLETEPDEKVTEVKPDAGELPFLGNINIPQNLQEILQTINAIKPTSSNQNQYEPSPAKKSRLD